MTTAYWTNTRAASSLYLNSRFRRVLDVAVASSLLILLAPIFCIIAIAIRLESPGPLFFRQDRYGRGMRPFEMLKFRSMYWSRVPEATVTQAIPGDPRVTPLGRILRYTSMDELPQLINIIRGDMSLVGPRPHAIEHDHYYAELIPNYRRRFQARPGLTGLAQVSGARGGTPQVEHMQRRIDFDLQYLENASVMLDCRIFLSTFKEVFNSQTAY
jgi:putative colanic acid biosysnthesis UDP-glucose lipid carrier transferase